jgi:glutathione transport system substrate-binding protein
VKFHDGTSFDANSVKFIFDRILGPENTLRKGTWAGIVANVDVVDQFTVRFTTKYVDPFFPSRVSDGSTASVFSTEAFKKYGKDIAKNPVGTGPFKFGEWVKDDHLAVERFDDYWGGAPYLDKVVVRPQPEAETRVIALEAGDAQLAIRLNPEHVSRVEGNRSLQLIRNDTTRHYYTGIANLKKPFSDLRVRQALNHAIDKDSLAKNILSGLGTVQGGLLPKGAASYAEVPGFAYDPAKAKQLLAEAGYPNGFTASFVGTKGIYLKDFEIEQAMQEMWKAVGVTINLNIVENAKYLELIRADPRTSTLEMWWDTFAGAGAGSADYIRQRFGCKQFRPVGTNTAGSCFPDIDTIADQAVIELDGAKRDALLKTVQERLSVQAPAVWLFSIKQLTGASAKLHDPVIRNESLYVDEKTWLEA